ncbi:hypothetical protein [Glycomyces tritici]|uniref:Thiol:disulfide interchange protein DsbD N-terminal domain-containing protein n=1 Tax=Glycomyces tritici TaxID=2665176 RepID=A0ABT7YVY8_9ACTN|nr:hypothetical protein [Glycomyces tritici]MDN3242782.1 hypothetical protein [Glycomyces tritici]
MKPPPQPTVRRALIAAVWLACVAVGLLAAVWAVGWAVEGGPQPSVATVASATRLDFPEGTEVTESDLSQMESPGPGDRAEVTVEIPSDAFDDFIADNAMEAPLLAGRTPNGSTTGIIPAACTDEICYAANIIVQEDAVTVQLDVTLI